MGNELQGPSFAERKKLLLAEGLRYRVAIIESRRVVQANTRADMLARNAVDHVTAAAYGAFNNIFSLSGLRTGGLQKLLPLVITGYTALSRRSLLKPVLRGSLVVAGLGAIAVLVFRNKRAKADAIDAASRLDTENF